MGLRPFRALTNLCCKTVDTSNGLSYSALPENMGESEPRQLFLDPVWYTSSDDVSPVSLLREEIGTFFSKTFVCGCYVPSETYSCTSLAEYTIAQAVCEETSPLASGDISGWLGF